jgi:hypothetical protein
MTECYCAKIEGGVVTQVIVCTTSEWAEQYVGGDWVCTDDRLVGIGWVVEDGKIVPPPEPGGDE